MISSFYDTQDKYLLQIKNYTNYLAMIIIDTIPIENIDEKIFKNTKKNFGYKHHYLRENSKRISLKLLSKRDSQSQVFSGSHIRTVTIGVENYYYSLYLYIPWKKAWEPNIINKKAIWKQDINLIIKL